MLSETSVTRCFSVAVRLGRTSGLSPVVRTMKEERDDRRLFTLLSRMRKTMS
jgi:hypothetical protein